MQAKSIRSQKRERAPIGYWAAQEQYSLQDLLNHIVQAEKAGFTRYNDKRPFSSMVA